MSQKRVLILSSSTGGGHLSTAAAITEALSDTYGENIACETVDVLKEYARQPLDKFPEAYRFMIKSPPFWRGFYEIGDSEKRAELVTKSISIYTRKQTMLLFEQHPADLVVSTFEFAIRPMMDTLKRGGSTIPFITVVTDLVTMTPIWFEKRTDLCIVPTPEASHAALSMGLGPEQIEIIGLPIAKRFTATKTSKTKLRQSLGYDPELPVIIIMAGAEGVGPLGSLTKALSTLKATIVTVCGRNSNVYKKLSSKQWTDNVHILNFVTDMPALMQAASILVTKAGPTTILEAFNTHLPIILYSRLPGQEVGNVDFVLSRNAGVWAPTPRQVREVAASWLDSPHLLGHFARGAASAAQPDAATRIAHAIGQQIGLN